MPAPCEGAPGTMFNQLLIGGLVSLANFGIHALMTGIIVVVTRHVAGGPTTCTSSCASPR